ncbi:MAG: hypothetical protein JWM44_2667 [Bacilli bacterium]|nr:hypothetical protein [Bacilli bacterium]
MPPYCDEHQMYYRMAYVDGLPWKQCVCVKCQAGRLTGFDIAQSAFESNEQLSETVADKGVLTEEELQEYKRHFTRGFGILPTLTMGYGIALIDEVNRLKQAELNYLSANAELSFKNNDLSKQLKSARELIMGEFK